MKKLLLFILTLSFAFLPIINHRIDATVFAAGQRVDKDKYTFLICGVDDAAENTDALILFNYSLASNEATFVQIPRDTYFRSCVGTDKINAIYPFLRSQGKSERESMQTVCDNLSFALGIDLDGYICYTL